MSLGPDFSLTETAEGQQITIAVGGELDLVSAPELAEAIGGHLQAGRLVRVDLREVSFIDSSGLAAIVTRAQDPETRARITISPSAHAQPNRLLEITGISDLLGQPSTD